MKTWSAPGHVNVGCGEDISIAELTRLVCRIVGFEGAIRNDLSRPDGTPRKLLDVGLLASRGWRPRISLEEGVAATYRWFLDNRTGPSLAHSA